jgi:predicted dehydrogenase
MLSSSLLTRRRFIQRSAFAGGAALAPFRLPSRLRARGAPGNQITLGVIGTGNIADNHFRILFGYTDQVRILAVCDVDRNRREIAAAWVNREYGNNDCATSADFREINRRADIDAVFICTPDHWHALIAIDAMRQGKDVYLEKPLTLTIAEGRAVVATARQHQRVLQHGTHMRSTKRFHDGAWFVRNHGLGRLEGVECWIKGNNRHSGATWTPEPVPPGLDWEMWLGPAPWRPYSSIGCHYNFRFIADNASGQITNLGAHSIDIGQMGLGMEHSGPVEIEGHGEFPSSGLYTTATKVDATFRYANGVWMRCRTRYAINSWLSIRFIGERGWLDISSERTTASSNDLLRELQAAGKGKLPPLNHNHHENFFACIRDRARPAADVEIGHRTATVCNLGQIAMILGRPLHWDPVKEEFRGDEMANRLRRRAMRSPWAQT